jgi:DNA-binding NarL/FixJ family response regulator
MGTDSYPNATAHRKQSTTRSLAVRVRAIVVDDCPDMIRTVTELLELGGNLVVIATATDGADAIAAVRVHEPDLVIMDVNMPRMNGFSAASLIKEIAGKTKILLMSSDDGPETGFAALDCGADGFISKASLIYQCRFHLHRLFPSHVNEPLAKRQMEKRERWRRAANGSA